MSSHTVAHTTIMTFRTKLGINLLVAVLLLTRWAEAGKIDSVDLLVGDWNTTLRCGDSWFASTLFPPRESQSVERIPQSRKGWERNRNFQCSLSLYPNGTFGLHPQVARTAGADSATGGQILPVHGKWTLHPNPYCVTDRFYDQVVLHSFPRVQKKVVDGQAEEILQSLSLDIQCRLTGHFSHGRLVRRFWGRDPRCFARGKLSHGVVVLNQALATDQKIGARPRIAATFAASRNIPSRSNLGSYSDNDESLYGY